MVNSKSGANNAHLWGKMTTSESEEVLEDMHTDIRNELFLAVEGCLSRLSKRYSTKEYDVLITFDNYGFHVEKAYL